MPRLTLGAYLTFCALMSFGVTIWLLFIKEASSIAYPFALCLMPKQDKESTSEDISVKAVYGTMWEICKLRRRSQPTSVHANRLTP